MDSFERQTYRFANIEVDLDRSCLLLAGEERHLRQKAFQVLVHLLQQRERLVSKNELFDTIWKDTAVTDDVLVQCITEIRRVVGDDPQHPRFIKTVPKAGYRFIGDVVEGPKGAGSKDGDCLDADLSNENEPPATERPRTASNARRRYAVLSGLLLICAMATVSYFWLGSAPQNLIPLTVIDGRKTVAVMFFDNQSGGAAFDWLREGLADMLIAGLSRSDKLTVLSREQLSTLLGRYVPGDKTILFDNARDIAGKSHAQYFVMGGFTQIGDTIRLDARIHETETGALLATESLTVERAEQLLTQIDLLSLRIANRLGTDPEEKREIANVATDSLEAYRFYSLGVEKAQAYHTAEAVRLFEKAIDLDPEFAMAQARIGYTYAVSAGETEKGKPYLEKAYHLAARLTEKDRLNIEAWYAIANLDYKGAIRSYREMIERFPLEIEAYSQLARLLRGENQPDEAIAVLRRGLGIDADAGNLYNSLGSILSGFGNHAEAIAAHERYVALAPNEPNAHDSLGLTYQYAGDYAKAVENYTRALELNPKFEIAIVHLGNARIRLGQNKEAAAAFHRYIDAASSRYLKARGYDSLAYIDLQAGNLALAERSNAASRKFDNEQNWNSYVVASRRGQRANAKVLESAILKKVDFMGRGARITRRLELYYRGTITFNNGQHEQAIDYFRQSISQPPLTWHYSDYEDCLADALLKLGRFDEAIVEYERILSANPNYPLARFHLGQAFKAKGMDDQARASFQTFLEVWKDADPDIPEVLRAKEFLGS